jgi:hypothetical protein
MGRQAVPPRTDVPAKVPGAVEQLQAGMVFQVGGDGAGMVDAVVVADHHEAVAAAPPGASGLLIGWPSPRSITKWTVSTNSSMVYSVH